MSLEFQSLFESVCRCLGHETVPGVSSSTSQTDGQSSVKRRTNRLELKDKQWDELFEKKKQASTSIPHKSKGKAVTDDSAEAVAEAKRAANPMRYRPKRKRSEKAREDIFRSKKAASNGTSDRVSSTPFSRLLHPSLVLCFATPIRGTEEEQDETDLRSENSDTNTLNTCEDTITSTVCFDNKYKHVVETTPPMPLFHQFKIGQDKDEIRNIIASDSHSSVKMIELLQQQKKQQKQGPMQLEDSSSDSDLERKAQQLRQRQQRPQEDEPMEDAVPDVKAVSSSTDSSRHS